jgi:hypothetical protein
LIYGDELERYASQKKLHAFRQQALTEAKRNRIKQNVRQEIKNRNIKMLISLSIALLLFIMLIFGILKIANYVLNNPLKF